MESYEINDKGSFFKLLAAGFALSVIFWSISRKLLYSIKYDLKSHKEIKGRTIRFSICSKMSYQSPLVISLFIDKVAVLSF